MVTKEKLNGKILLTGGDDVPTKKSIIEARYHKKAFKYYSIGLHLKNDAELVEYVESEKRKGKSVAQVLRDLYEKGK